MKICRYILFFIGAFLINITIARGQGQDSSRYISENDTTVGIPITKVEFDNKVSNYIKQMSDWAKFTPSDYVEMVRIFNTIGDSHLIKIDYYRMYYHVFMVMYIKIAGKTLDTKMMKGLSLYSKKYNLWIGDRPFGNNNSEFRINKNN